MRQQRLNNAFETFPHVEVLTQPVHQAIEGLERNRFRLVASAGEYRDWFVQPQVIEEPFNQARLAHPRRTVNQCDHGAPTAHRLVGILQSLQMRGTPNQATTRQTRSKRPNRPFGVRPHPTFGHIRPIVALQPAEDFAAVGPCQGVAI